MAKTSKNNIYYNDDENSIADVLADMKKLAESTDEAIENAKYDDKQIKQEILTLKKDNVSNKDSISNIEKKNIEKDKDITNNIKSIEELKTENEALKAENKLIKEQISSASASGNSVHIEDSGTLEFDWKIRGGHKQETREGYNKINLSSISTEVAGIKASYDNETGDITFDGSSTQGYCNFYSKNIDELLTDGETWTVWQEKAATGINHEIYLQVAAMGKNGVANIFYNSTAYERRMNHFTVDKTKYTYYTDLGGAEIEKIGTLTNYKNRYMLYKGTDDKEYEQYGVSPSSYYPSEIETVGSNINYFDENTVESKFLNSKTGQTSDNASWRCTDFVEILSKQYNFSWESESEYFQVTVCYYDKNKTFISGDEYGLFKMYSKTFEIPDGANYMKVAYSIAIQGKPVTRDKIKLEVGNKRTSYSPYMCGSVEKDVVNKNFLVLDNVDEQTVNEMKYSCQNGEIEVQGTATATLDLFFPCKIVGYNNICTLNASADGELDKNACAIRMLKEGKNVTNANSFGNVYRTLKKPQIVPITADMKREKYQYICIHINEGTTANFKLKVWLNWGTDVTDYTRSQSQTAIMPVQQEMLEGDYIADVEHHEWGKLVLTGNENFVQNQNANKLNYFYLGSNSVKLRGKIISNMLKSVENGIIWGKTSYDDIVSSSFNSKTINIMLSDTTITTLQQFKKKLKELYNAGTPIIIYYELTESIDLELTSEQKAVRDTKLYTCKNITNISLSDELASIDVNYKKDPTTEHDELQNQIDEIKQLISTTETSALLLDNLQKDVESEVE